MLDRVSFTSNSEVFLVENDIIKGQCQSPSGRGHEQYGLLLERVSFTSTSEVFSITLSFQSKMTSSRASASPLQDAAMSKDAKILIILILRHTQTQPLHIPLDFTSDSGQQTEMVLTALTMKHKEFVSPSQQLVLGLPPS